MLNFTLKKIVMIITSLLLIITSYTLYFLKEKRTNDTYICESDIYFHSMLLNKNIYLSGNYVATIYPQQKIITITLNGKTSSDNDAYILNRKLTFSYSLMKKGRADAIQIIQKGNDKAGSDNTPDMIINNFFSTAASGRLVFSRMVNERTMIIGPVFSPSIICAINKL